jgi:L-cystine uptake protein TcyP (sodium:dicarboxylate symporter family)
MSANWNTAVSIVFGLLLGVVFGLSIEQIALDPIVRTAAAKWLYDWQQLLSGFLALIAAAIAALLLWKQVTDTARQARSAELQARLATADSISRHVANVDNVGAELGSLYNCQIAGNSDPPFSRRRTTPLMEPRPARRSPT